MMGKLGYHLDVRNRLVEDDAIDRTHVLLDDLKKRSEALRCLARGVQWDNYSHSVFLGYFNGFGVIASFWRSV
jgi:hypothetical protein